MEPPSFLSLQPLYEAYDAAHRPPEPERALSAMQLFCKRRKVCCSLSAFDRINQCRRGLEALDRQGWLRSYHQRQFHEQFIRACARIFYKTEPQAPSSATTSACCRAMVGRICRRRS